MAANGNGNGNGTTAVVAAPKRDAVVLVENYKEKMLAALPTQIGAERFYSIALAVANSSDLSECSPASILMAIYGCARLGLTPDPALGHVYVLPRKKRAEVQVGYRGYMELAGRSRAIAAVHAEVVFSNDEFDEDKGSNRRITHRPWYIVGAVEAGEPRFAYVTWRDLRSDTIEHHVITSARVDRARKTSQSAGSSYSPWNNDPIAMWKKTAVIDASKSWPLSPELAQAVAWDEQAERGEPQVLPADGLKVENVASKSRLRTLNDEPPPTPPANNNGNGHGSDGPDEEELARIHAEEEAMARG